MSRPEKPPVIFSERGLSYPATRTGLMTMLLTAEALELSFGYPALAIPLARICTAQVAQHALTADLVVTYMDERDCFKVLTVRTRQARRWADELAKLGVAVVPLVV